MYNGWRNYSTWCAKLWLDDSGLTEEVEDIDGGELIEFLKEDFDSRYPELTGVYSDLLAWASDQIDWREIAEAILEDRALDGGEVE